MVLILEIDRPFPGHKMHHEERLADQKQDGKEKEQGFPNSVCGLEPRVVADVVVPKLGPTKHDDKAPQGIEDRQKKKANRLSSREVGPKHAHHFPGPVQIDDRQGDPGDEPESGQREEERPGVFTGDVLAEINQATGDEEGQEKEEEVCRVEVGQIKPSGWAVPNGPRFWRGIGIAIAKVGWRNRVRPSFLSRNKAKDATCCLLVVGSVFPNEVMTEEFSVDGESTEFTKVHGAIGLAFDLIKPSRRT